MEKYLHRALKDLALFLKAEKIPFALIGGLAISVRGEPRFTADIDVVLNVEIAQARQLLTRLKTTPFQPLFPDAKEVLEVSLILPLKHKPTQVTIDMALGLSGFEKQIIDRATEVRFARNKIPTATAEDLFIMKVVAGRPRDLEDIGAIIARHRNRLDWAYIEKTAMELEQVLEYELLPTIKRLASEVDLDDAIHSSDSSL